MAEKSKFIKELEKDLLEHRNDEFYIKIFSEIKAELLKEKLLEKEIIVEIRN